MSTAFQASAFQNNAFQIDAAVVVFDTHDAGHDHRRRYDDERERKRLKKHQILEAYEFLVEGKSPVVAEIVAPFMEQPKMKAGRERPPIINFDRMIADIEAAQELWEAYIEMDDMEVISLL